jgi:hypothetical protein
MTHLEAQPLAPQARFAFSRRAGAATPNQVLAIVCVGICLANLDLFIVNVALPNVSRNFGDANMEDLSWVLNGYAIVYAALLVFFGRLVERYRRDLSFLAGVALFTVASAACAAAQGVWGLVAFRVLQAAGAALMTPTSLGLLLTSFPPEKRGAAVRTWTAIGGFAAALGPLAGGLLLTLSWRWIFLVNVPACTATIRMNVVLPHPGMLLSRPGIASSECSRDPITLSIDRDVKLSFPVRLAPASPSRPDVRSGDQAPAAPLANVTSQNLDQTGWRWAWEETCPGSATFVSAPVPNTISCAFSRRHSFNRRCSVRSCPSGKTPGCSACSRSNNSRDVRHGSASNQARISAVTATNGSGRRRPRGALSFALLVGRTSPSCHAMRSPTRNCSIVGAVGGAASTVTGRSAISTNSCCAERMLRNKATGSKVVCIAVTRRRTSSLVRASASSRWDGVAGG